MAFASPSEQGRHVVDEVVDDPLRLLHDVGGVQRAPLGYLALGAPLVDQPAVGGFGLVLHS